MIISLCSWNSAGLVALAAVSLADISYRRVPNVLSLLVLSIGVGYWSEADGLRGMGFALRGAASGFGLLLLVHLAGLLGAGDVKVFAGFGAWLGAKATFWALVYGSLVGGLLTVCVVVQSGLSLREIFDGMGHGGLHTVLDRARKHGATVPYAAALALGTLAAGTLGVP